MAKDFWVRCSLCGHRWIASMVEEFGGLLITGEAEDGCIECGAHPDRLDIEGEYRPMSIQGVR